MNTLNQPQNNARRKKETFFERWQKRLWNFIPSMKAIGKGITFCFKKFAQNLKNKDSSFLKELMDCFKRIKRTINAFSKYEFSSNESKASDCFLDEKPIIIKIESNSLKNRHFHGGSYYDGIAVDSDGRGNNGTPDGKMEDPVDTTATYFILYPSQVGLDSQKLKEAMIEEAQKENDYDFYTNNCINHVIRPLCIAGAKLDFGEIATPRELCMWCDNLCAHNFGFRLSETEYKKLLTRFEVAENNTQKNLQSFCLAAELLSDIQKRDGQKGYHSKPMVQKRAEGKIVFPPYQEKGLQRCA